MKATIFEIKRFAVHDGDGIRTTVFFKGCPLRCVWCHNPEGLTYEHQDAFYEHKCIGCGECKKEEFTPDGCLGDARVRYGRDVTVDELIPLLLEDHEFYENSGGGVTLSGGECLSQVDFVSELLRRLKECGISTAVDTSGYAPRSSIDRIIPYTDVFLYDIKAVDEQTHVRCTGVSNKIIIDNLLYLDHCQKPVEIRIPYVPGYNDGEIGRIGELIKSLTNVTRVRVLPYHNYARSKYESLGMKITLPDITPTDDEIREAERIIKKISGK